MRCAEPSNRSPGSSEKIFWYDAVMVTIRSHTNGTPGIQAHLNRPFFMTTVETTVSAIAASSWLAMPKSGKSVLMPPSGSVTPMSRIAPHAATTMSEQIHAPTRHDGSLNFFAGPPKLPSESESMNRATRVPASTVVRMNSASNMIAKWYQNDLSDVAAEARRCSTSDMPNASVGAPPVREMIDSSPTAVGCLRQFGRCDVAAGEPESVDVCRPRSPGCHR